MQYDFSFDEIKFYVSHLMKWQKPVIINALSKHSTFTLDPKYLFKSSDIEKIPKKYQSEYSSLIKGFEDPKMIQNLTGENVEMGLIIKLLQIDLLKECNRYIYLRANKDLKIDKFYPKTFDLTVYTILKKYSLKRNHIHEIAWKEDIVLKEIINVLKYNADTFGTYFI